MISFLRRLWMGSVPKLRWVTFDASKEGENHDASGVIFVGDDNVLILRESMSEVVAECVQLLGIDSQDIEVETERSGYQYCNWEGWVDEKHVRKIVARSEAPSWPPI